MFAKTMSYFIWRHTNILWRNMTHTTILLVTVISTIIIVVTFPAGSNAFTVTTLKFRIITCSWRNIRYSLQIDNKYRFVILYLQLPDIQIYFTPYLRLTYCIGHISRQRIMEPYVPYSVGKEEIYRQRNYKLSIFFTSYISKNKFPTLRENY